ncbi:MAG: hypothetical protein JJU45_05435 [Acidimicrobiia bacterium]|nr:hypothetical protein [Acidimicrobiia bacterium]
MATASNRSSASGVARRAAGFFLAAALVVPLACAGDDSDDADAGTTTEAGDTPPGGTEGGDPEGGVEGLEGVELGDPGEAPAAQMDSELGEESEAEGGPAAVAADGTVTVDGRSYAMEEIAACGNAAEGWIEAVVVGSGDGEEGRLDIELTPGEGLATQFAQWSGPEGNYSTSFLQSGDVWLGFDDEEVGDQPYRIDDGRVVGAAALTARDGSRSTVEVTVDVAVPADLAAC